MNMVKYTVFIFIIALIVVFSFAIMFPKSFDQIRKAAELAIKTGQLSIGGRPPEVQQIYIEDKACNVNFAESPGVLGVADNPSNKQFKAYIYDINGNCNGATLNVYVCLNTTALPCNENSDVWTSGMGSPTSPDGNIHCNFTSTGNFPLQYFYRWGIFKVNVTAVDASGVSVGSNSTTQYWYYNQIIAPEYPYPVAGTINFGSVNIGVWNNGLPSGGNSLKNTGNIRLNITWNTSDFLRSGGGGTIPIITNNFCVDRDVNNVLDGPGGSYPQQCMNDNELIVEWYQPYQGVQRCGNSGCTDDEQAGGLNNASFVQYWHINIPVGTPEGTYTDNIRYQGEAAYGAW